MLCPAEAQSLISQNTKVLPTEYVSLDQAGGRILSQDLYAVCDLPPFDNSAMDGFAVRSHDTKGASQQTPMPLSVLDKIRAGSISSLALQKGQAVRIMTGAPVPAGADSIAIKEATEDRRDGHVNVLYEFNKGDHIRTQGEDVRAGDFLLARGTRLRAYEVALLAAQGWVLVPVVQKPRVAILATGDELVAPHQHLTPGKIRNANGPAMVAALNRWNVTANDEGICSDDPVALEQKMKKALLTADVLLISGGVSVGDYDLTQDILKKIGVEIVFWKVAIKPGKPLLFGVWPPDKLVFGLPGNPISALVCLEEFVRPALEAMQSNEPHYPSYHLTGRVENDFIKTPQRQHYLFCRVKERDDGFHLHILRPQGSAMLGMAVQANALAVAPAGVSRISKGEALPFRWIK